MVRISAERSTVQEVCRRCTGGGGDKCRKVKYMGCVREVVGISAERSSVWEVHGICMGGGGDNCRKVKCAGGSGISAESE